MDRQSLPGESSRGWRNDVHVNLLAVEVRAVGWQVLGRHGFWLFVRWWSTSVLVVVVVVVDDDDDDVVVVVWETEGS